MASRKEVITKLFGDLKNVQETRKVVSKVTNPNIDDCNNYRNLVELEETIATELTQLLKEESENE